MPTLKTAVATKDAPPVVGPCSQAIRVREVLYASGQVALDPATGLLVAGGIAEQTTRALENIKSVLAAAGFDMSHVIKTTVFLKKMSDFAAMNGIYAKYVAPDGAVPRLAPSPLPRCLRKLSSRSRSSPGSPPIE